MEHPRKLPAEQIEARSGRCCFCHEPLTPEHFTRKEVTSCTVEGKQVLCCTRHFRRRDGSKMPTYEDALAAMTRGVQAIANELKPGIVVFNLKEK